MKVIGLIPSNIKIIPTRKKFEKAEQFAEQVSEKSGLQKKMPIERNIYIQTAADIFEKTKNKIQIAIDKIKQ